MVTVTIQLLFSQVNFIYIALQPEQHMMPSPNRRKNQNYKSIDRWIQEEQQVGN